MFEVFGILNGLNVWVVRCLAVSFSLGFWFVCDVYLCWVFRWNCGWVI